MSQELRDVQRDDELKRLVAASDIPRFGVRRGDLGGLVDDYSRVSDDSWIAYGSRVRRSTIILGAYVSESTINDSTIEGGAIISSSISRTRMRQTLSERAFVFNCIVDQTQLAQVRRAASDAEHLHRYLQNQARSLENKIAADHLPISDSSLENADSEHEAYAIDIVDSFLRLADIRGQSGIDSSWIFDGKICDCSISNSYVMWSELQGRSVSNAKVKSLRHSNRIRLLRHRLYDPAGLEGKIPEHDSVKHGNRHRFTARFRHRTDSFKKTWSELPSLLRFAIGVTALVAFVGTLVIVPPEVSDSLGVLMFTALISGLVLAIVGLTKKRISRRLGRRLENKRAEDVLVWLFILCVFLMPIAMMFAVRVGSDPEIVGHDSTGTQIASVVITVPPPVYVASSNLSAVAYDHQHSYLYIWFHGGGLYRYDDVDESTYQQLLSAVSKGRYHASNIRGHYSYTQLN